MTFLIGKFFFHNLLLCTQNRSSLFSLTASWPLQHRYWKLPCSAAVQQIPSVNSLVNSQKLHDVSELTDCYFNKRQDVFLNLTKSFWYLYWTASQFAEQNGLLGRKIGPTVQKSPPVRFQKHLLWLQTERDKLFFDPVQTVPWITHLSLSI